MAPKRLRASAMKKDRKTRKRSGNATELFKCIDNLCGEECDQPVVDAMDGVSEYDDDDYEVRAPPPVRSGRVAKPKPKKALKEVPFKVGVEKAQRYICEALDFGLNTGYITSKDSKGKVLVLSKELLEMTDAIKERTRRAPQAAGSEARRTGAQQRAGKRHAGPEHAAAGHQQEVRDDEDGGQSAAGDVDEARARRRKRSHSKRHGRKRSGKSRSRSRSKRRARRRAGGRSRSINAADEPRKQNKTGESPQDGMGEEANGNNANSSNNNNNNNNNNSNNNTSNGSSNGGNENKEIGGGLRNSYEADDDENDDEEDDKSTKSSKSIKSGKQQRPSESRQASSVEEKGVHEYDGNSLSSDDDKGK